MSKLYLYFEQPKRQMRLNKAINTSPDDVRDVLSKWTGDHAVNQWHDRIVIEVADFLESLMDADLDDLKQAIHSLDTLTTMYYVKLKQLDMEMDQLRGQTYLTVNPIPQDRPDPTQQHKPEEIVRRLQWLDTYYAYRQQSEGAGYNRLESYNWLKYQLTEVINRWDKT